MTAKSAKQLSQTVTLSPVFGWGDKLLAPQMSVKSTAQGQIVSGKIEGQAPGKLMSAQTAKEYGATPDAWTINLYEVLSGLGLDLPAPLDAVLNSNISNAEFSYNSSDKTTLVNMATEHFAVTYLSTSGAEPAKGLTLVSMACTSGLDVASLMPLIETSNLPEFTLTGSMLYASKAMSKQDMVDLQASCNFEGSDLLTLDKLEAGISAVVNMKVADDVIPLYLPLQSESKPETPASETATKTTEPVTTSEPVGKSLGPISITSFGLDYADGDVILSVDGALNLSNFQMMLMGLALKLNFTELMQGNFSKGLGFDLDGLYLAMQTGGIGLSGGLLRQQITENGKTRDEYVGQISLNTQTFSLTALAAYSKLSNGDHSLFAYLALNYPLGGIPPFFVEGLALGFGYNRGVMVPQISKINQFPLVTALKGGDNLGKQLDASSMAAVREKFASLSRYLPAMSDQYVIAAGLKFSTFKLVDSIAVLMVEFGRRLTLHLVGTSEMRLPYGASTPVVSIEMAYKVSLIPDDGVISIDALLTDNSFVLSRDCKLTGGFAYYSWFKGQHSGDFVVCMGGYHPRFKKPDHYPSVPRLRLQWQLSSKLSFKGKMYAALTPIAIMAGGGVEASYRSGSLKAWFNAGFNFIIYWQPFYYEADFSISIGARVRISLGFLGSASFSTELGAKLNIWGPKFTGKAKVNWSVFEFTIRFGAGGKPKPKPISWSDFASHYIPKKAEELVEINVLAGERAVVDGWHIVDPDEFALSVGSQIPVNQVSVNDNQIGPSTFHLAPMGAVKTSDWRMSLTTSGPDGVKFTAKKLNKNYPKAVWGPDFQPNLSSKDGKKDTILSLLSGLHLVPAPGKPPGFTEAIDADEFKFEDIVENDPFWQWGEQLPQAQNSDAAQNRDTMVDTLLADKAQNQRAAVADFFGCDDTIDVTQMHQRPDSAFIGTPNTVTA